MKHLRAMLSKAFYLEIAAFFFFNLSVKKYVFTGLL